MTNFRPIRLRDLKISNFARKLVSVDSAWFSDSKNPIKNQNRFSGSCEIALGKFEHS